MGRIVGYLEYNRMYIPLHYEKSGTNKYYNLSPYVKHKKAKHKEHNVGDDSCFLSASKVHKAEYKRRLVPHKQRLIAYILKVRNVFFHSFVGYYAFEKICSFIKFDHKIS